MYHLKLQKPSAFNLHEAGAFNSPDNNMVGKIEKNRRKLGIKSINGILGDLGIPYTFISHKETKGERRNQTYCMLKAI